MIIVSVNLHQTLLYNNSKVEDNNIKKGINKFFELSKKIFFILSLEL